MTVSLIVHKVVPEPERMWQHDAYRNIVKQHGWCASDRENLDLLNQVLSSYNGHVNQFKMSQITFEFESKEDLTQFVLTWS